MPEDIASYLHTGDTTGTPKLAARTHANEVSNAWMIRASTVLDDGRAASSVSGGPHRQD